MSKTLSTPAETGALTVNLANVRDNWRLLDQLSGGAECGAVIKADGYGLGLETVMRALIGAGCRTFFVADVVEGERARAVSGDAVVFVLDGLVPGLAARLAAARLTPVLSSPPEIEEWAAFAGVAGKRLPAALHFDTGMNRLGLAVRDAARAADLARAFETTLVMSHFVSSQWPGDPRNDGQIAAFETARGHFPGVAASMANSSGVFLPSKPHYQLVRPGYALYGGNPTPGLKNPMKPAAFLSARILVTRWIEPGETVGYDATFTATRRTRLAAIGAGYADGLPVSASGGPDKPAGEALVGGVLCPFVGRVSMDFIVLDVTEAPEQASQRGGWAEILGETIGVDELATRAGTIGYEILTRLGARYARRSVEE